MGIHSQLSYIMAVSLLGLVIYDLILMRRWTGSTGLT